MSLFDAPKGSILVHANNAKGVWGSGIALEFKKRFPDAYAEHSLFCKRLARSAIGKANLVPSDLTGNPEYHIGNLITSSGFGETLDPVDVILVNTVCALDSLCSLGPTYVKSIYSNKFNSGLFRVPWEKTEKILKVFVTRCNLNWTVCEL